MPEHGQTTAAAALVSELETNGVTTVFALPGEENLPVVSALRTAAIDVIVCRHEQHAGFMAVAHARLTGQIAVCLATLGPGALNTFTPLAQAQLMRVPLLVLTGQKAVRNNREGSFQLVDVVGAARPVAKLSTSVIDPGSIRAAVRRALSCATTPPWGPVLLEVPEDVADGGAGDGRIVDHPPGPVPAVWRGEPDLTEVNERIAAAVRPLILAGSECAQPPVAAALANLANRENLPVLTTQMGKGAIDERSSMSLGSLGIHRPDHVHAALHAADLVVAVGYTPAEHPAPVWNRYGRPVVHLAHAPAAIEVGYDPVIQAVGNLPTLLTGLVDLGVERWHDDVRDRIGSQLGAERSVAAERRGSVADPIGVVEAVEKVAEEVDRLVVSLDNGAYKIWFARHYLAGGPRSLLLDNALATMGAGLATGMEAARLGHPSLVVTGDGGFLMNVGDLETAVRLGLDLTIVVLRDDRYGFIAWHQDEQDRARADVDVGNPDLVALAEAFGGRGRRVTNGTGLSTAITASVDSGGLWVIDCPITYETNDLLDPSRLPDFPLED